MKLKDLLTDETKWCRGTHAVNERNEPTDPCNDYATRWCLVGALRKIYGIDTKEFFEAKLKLEEAVRRDSRDLSLIGPRCISIPHFNDYVAMTFPRIKKLIDSIDV
jgi:hypothetical protein